MTQDTFPLPNSIITSPPSSPDSGTTFPRLKVKFTPRVTLPSNVVPQKPKPKALEETIKVVAKLGGKITITWSVNAASLEETFTLPEGAQEAFEDSIGGWILKNRDPLGIEDAAWATGKDGMQRATSLLISPISASPSHSPLTTHIIPLTEPTAALVRVELTFWWQAQGKRKADELDCDDNHNDLAAEDSNSTSKLRSPAGARSGGSSQSTIKSMALEQIASLMPEVLRRQMIRRFPYVFDGSFLDYRTHLVLPPSLLTALSTFAVVSARHRPEFLVKCGGIISKLEESRRHKVEGQIKAVALLPAKMKPGRRKIEAQGEPQSQEDSQRSREQLEEDASYLRAAVAIKAARRADADLGARQRLHRLVAEKVGAVGMAKWLDVRRKGGRMAASRRAVDAPDVDYSQGPPIYAVEEKTLPRQWRLASLLPESPPRHRLPIDPRHYHPSLPLPIWDDAYDDLDHEDDNLADLEDDLGYGWSDGYGDSSDAYGTPDGQSDGAGDGYVAYRDDRAPPDYYDDDLEDDYDEEIGTPRHSSHHRSPRIELGSIHVIPWGTEAADSLPLARFNSLQLSDVPAPSSSAYGILHPVYSDDDVDHDLDTPVASDLYDDDDGLLADDLDDDLDGPLSDEFRDDLHRPLRDSLDPRFGGDQGGGHDDDLGENLAYRHHTSFNAALGERYDSDLDEGFDWNCEKASRGNVEDEYEEDPDETHASRHQDSFGHDSGGALVDDLDEDELDYDLDNHLGNDQRGEHAAADDWHSASPLGVTTPSPGNSSTYSMTSQEEDGGLVDEPQGESDSSTAAASPMAVGHALSLSDLDDDLGFVFNDFDSLDGIDDPPERKSEKDASVIRFTTAIVPQDPFFAADQPELDLDFGGITSHSQPLSSTQPMAISQPALHGRPTPEIATKTLNPPDNGLELDDWGDDQELEIWDNTWEHAIPFQDMRGMDEEFDERNGHINAYSGDFVQPPDKRDDERGQHPWHHEGEDQHQRDEYELQHDQGEYDYQPEQDECAHQYSEFGHQQGDAACEDGFPHSRDEHYDPPHAVWPPAADELQRHEMVEDGTWEELDHAPAAVGSAAVGAAAVHDPCPWDYRETVDGDDLDDLEDDEEYTPHPPAASGDTHGAPHAHLARPAHSECWPTDEGGGEHDDLNDLNDLDDLDDLDGEEYTQPVPAFASAHDNIAARQAHPAARAYQTYPAHQTQLEYWADEGGEVCDDLDDELDW